MSCGELGKGAKTGEPTEPMFSYEFWQLARYEDGRTPVLLSEEQYQRVQACVNACAGLSNEFLSVATRDDYAMRLVWEADEMRRQRDELMAALEKLTDVFANIGITSGLYDDEQDVLKAASDLISRMKGSTS